MTNTPKRQRPAQPEPCQGYLNRRCATIGELLSPAGYTTLMAGKWHLGDNAPCRPQDVLDVEASFATADCLVVTRDGGP